MLSWNWSRSCFKAFISVYKIILTEHLLLLVITTDRIHLMYLEYNLYSQAFLSWLQSLHYVSVLIHSLYFSFTLHFNLFLSNQEFSPLTYIWSILLDKLQASDFSSDTFFIISIHLLRHKCFQLPFFDFKHNLYSLLVPLMFWNTGSQNWLFYSVVAHVCNDDDMTDLG